MVAIIFRTRVVGLGLGVVVVVVVVAVLVEGIGVKAESPHTLIQRTQQVLLLLSTFSKWKKHSPKNCMNN